MPLLQRTVQNLLVIPRLLGVEYPPGQMGKARVGDQVAQKYLQLKSGEYYKCFGKVDKVVGLTIESIGPKAKLNDLCMIFLDKERRDYVMSEVVGFKDSHIILMPFDNVE